MLLWMLQMDVCSIPFCMDAVCRTDVFIEDSGRVQNKAFPVGVTDESM